MTNKLTVPSELIHRAIDAIEQVGYQDKFIDYTFVRAVKQELRAALAEPTIGIDHETMRARYTDPEAVVLSSGTGSTLRVVVAEPVPPAGGEPEALIDQLDDYIARINRDDRGSNATVNELRGHVTQLQAEAVDVSKSYEALAHVYAATQKGFEKMQAERDALKAELRKTNLTNQDFVSQIGDLQSELTKALELLRNCTDCVRNGEDFDLPVTTMSGIDAFLSNQSAPADKGHANPEHTLFNEIRISEPVNEDGEPTRYLITEAQLQRIRALEADNGQGEPVAVMYADGSVLTKAECGTAFETCCKVETPLYAEQPSPTTGYTAVDMSTAAAQGCRDGQEAAVAVELADRSPEDYAIEHAEYMAKSADDVLAKFQAYGVALIAVDEGGDDGEGELFEAIDTARGDLQESLVDLRGMVYEFRKRSSRCKSL